MTKRIATLVMAMGMCMGLANSVTTVALAQSQDETQSDDKMKDDKMAGDKMKHHKMTKKGKKHKKDKMEDKGKMDEQKN